MKNFFVLLLMLLFINSVSAEVMKYEDAIKQQKPYAMLVYADWADNCQKSLTSFNQISQSYGDKYNFVLIDIASSDAKEFNKTMSVYPNIPYVVLMRDKFTRFLKTECVIDNACFAEKLQLFSN